MDMRTETWNRQERQDRGEEFRSSLWQAGAFLSDILIQDYEALMDKISFVDCAGSDIVKNRW